MRKLFLFFLKKKLKLLAKLTINKYRPGIIGVTGNVGKTSVKEAIAAVLKRERKVNSSSKSFNNEIGLPLAVLGDWPDTGGVYFWFKVIIKSIGQLIWKNPNYPDILILEYGVDRPGDMDYLLAIARPSVGVLTAVGDIPVHVEFFAGPEGVLKEKSKLIMSLPTTGFTVLNADDAGVLELKSKSRGHVITFGFSEMSEMRIINFENWFDGKNGGVSFKLSYGGNVVPVKINGFLGKTQAYASAAAAAVGLIFGLNLVKISEALTTYEGPPGRMRILPGLKNTVIIDDTYNASPLAMQAALETVGSFKAKRKIGVLGDMLEIGRYTFEAHENIGRLAAKTLNLLLTVGIRGKIIAETAKTAGLAEKNIFHFNTVNEIGPFLQSRLQKGDLILIKASQAVRLEKVVEEIMAEPAKTEKLLVRQNKAWLNKPGIYDAPIV